MGELERRIEAIDQTLEKMRTTLKSKHPNRQISDFTQEIPLVKCRFAECEVLRGHSSKISSLSWNKVHFDLLSSVSSDGSIIIWDISTFTPIQKLFIPNSNLTSCTYEPTFGELLATGNFEGNIYVYLSSKETPILAFKSHSSYISDLLFLDLQHLITASGDHSAKVWDVSKGVNEVGEFLGHTEDIMCLSGKENSLITGSCDHTAKLWDLRTGKLLRTFETFLGDVNSVKFLSEYTFLTGSSEGMMRIWDLRGLNAIGFYKVSGKVESVESSQSGRVLFSAGSDCDVKVWDSFREERPIQTLPRGCGSIALGFGNRGYLAGCFEENVVIWQHVGYS